MICPWCLSTAVLEFVNGMWNAVDRGAPKFLAEGDEEYSSSGCQYLLDTVRKVGREMSRLDDLVRVEVPSINGIPESNIETMGALHEWVKDHLYCQRDLIPTRGGFSWCDTLEGDMAFALFDKDGGGVDLLEQFPETFRDCINVGEGGVVTIKFDKVEMTAYLP